MNMNMHASFIRNSYHNRAVKNQTLHKSFSRLESATCQYALGDIRGFSVAEAKHRPILHTMLDYADNRSYVARCRALYTR